MDFINITDSEIPNYNAEDNLEELNILSMHEDYDSSIMTIQNSRLIIKIAECDIFSGGNEIDKMPEIFFKKRNLLIMKNDDNKCFLYCYIRKFKNVITNKTSKITKIDLLIAEEIIDECNMDFENVSLDELDKIENLLKVNIHIFRYDKRYLDIDYNYKGKNLSKIILDVENQILQIMINYFISKNVNILTLEYDGLKIYTDKYSKHFSINELELNIYKNIGIIIKLAFKNIEDSFPDFGIRCNTDNIKNKNIIENKIKIVHHDHCLEKK